MEILIGLVVLFLIFGLPAIMREYTFSNRTSPPGYRTDWSAMSRDRAFGLSNNQIKDKFNRGGYDIPDPYKK